MAIKLFQHSGAPAWRQQIERHPFLRDDPTKWARNNTWDGVAGWEGELPPGLWMPSNDFAVETEVRKRTNSDGSDSYVAGIAARPLEVKGVVYYQDVDDAFDWERKVKRWAVRPFLKLSYRDDCYINLGAFRGLEWEVRPCSDRTWAEVRMTWQIDDPYWYERDLTIIPYQGSGPTISVTYGSDDLHHFVWPVIELHSTAQTGHTNVGNYTHSSAFTYSQRTAGDGTSGPNFTVGNPVLNVGQKVIIDTENATVLRYQSSHDPALAAPQANLISSFSGEFWPIYPGTNLLVFSGTWIYQLIKFRKRWL